MNTDYKSIRKETMVDYLLYSADIRLQWRRKITINLSQYSWHNNQFIIYFRSRTRWFTVLYQSFLELVPSMWHAEYDVTDICCSRRSKDRFRLHFARSPAPSQADSTILLLLLRVTSDPSLQAPHEERRSNFSLGCIHIRHGGAGWVATWGRDTSQGRVTQ